LVAALMFTACVLAASCLYGILLYCVAPDRMTGKGIFGPGAFISALLCFAVLCAAYGVYTLHWNNTCHRMGGTLDGDKVCVQGPIRKIKVP
jgi:hypothetical protein